MIQKMLASALIAGGAAGLIAALLHFAFVQEYILLGEQYESGAISHVSGDMDHMGESGGAPMAAGHSHDGDTVGMAVEGHSHAHAAGDETSAITRNSLTVLFSVLVYASYGLLLVAGFSLARSFGHEVTAREGVLWGIAGFAAFQLFPAMGLAPELPGTLAADLGARQVWWWGTVLSSTCGLGLLAYGRGALTIAGGVVLLALPHLIGAPTLGEFTSSAPADLGASFAARVLGVGLIVWASLGWIAGALWAKDRTDA